LVVYFKGANWEHAGIYLGHSEVESQWGGRGAGIFRHGIHQIPSIFGSNPQFYFMPTLGDEYPFWKKPN
jgi:hypothetical protein